MSIFIHNLGENWSVENGYNIILWICNVKFKMQQWANFRIIGFSAVYVMKQSAIISLCKVLIYKKNKNKIKVLIIYVIYLHIAGRNTRYTIFMDYALNINHRYWIIEYWYLSTCELGNDIA